jgi:protocatechuate 3,4-dioxygenase beta subunit
MKINQHRRRLLLGLSGLLLPGSAAALLSPTPRQTPGPFYPQELPLDQDNDLTRITSGADIKPAAKGEITDLSGRLLDRSGRPLANRRIEIWQCDAYGRYRHPYDQGGASPDPGFQGFGATTTDAYGRYRFRTIRPVPYPGRTPHIHVAVKTDPGLRFTTQMYVAGEGRNDGDFLFRRIPAEKRALVLAEFRDSTRKGSRYTAEFDIVLGESLVGSWEPTS